MSSAGDLRARVAAALEPLNADWSVHDAPVDAITPPAFILTWPDPWLVQRTACSYDARLQIVAAAARIDPAPGYLELEAMLELALPALVAAGVPAQQVGGSTPFEVGGLQYQAARLIVAYPLKIGA